MNYHEPMADSITDGLNFDDEYVDPYDIREPTWDEIKQERIDALDDVLLGITRSLNKLAESPMTRNQA